MADTLTRGDWDALLGAAVELHKGYDPSEPRDDHGRWTGGGGSAALGVHPEPTPIDELSERSARDLVRSQNPSLDFKVVSESDDGSNCASWSFGDRGRWWWPDSDHFWPEDSRRHPRAWAFDDLVEELGGREVDENMDLSGRPPPGVVRLALFTDHGEPTHISRQLDSGEWLNKLGWGPAITVRDIRKLEDGGLARKKRTGFGYGKINRVYEVPADRWRGMKDMK